MMVIDNLSESPGTPGPQPHSIRILLVEHIHPDAVIVERVLAATHLSSPSLRHVTGIQEAQDLLSTEEFDAALVDLALPGTAPADNIAALHNQAPTLPVIMLVCPDNDEEEALQAIRSGAYDYMDKEALSPVVMQRSIENVLRRKETEAALQRSLSLLAATLESTADGVLVVDQSGRITSYNHKFAEMWRIPSETLKSGEDKQVLSYVLNQLEDPEAFLSKIDELYNDPDAESYDVLRLNDGRVFERYSQPQRINGKSVGRVWSFRDASERERVVQALRQSEQRYRQMFERNQAVKFLIEPNTGVIVDANPAAAAYYGYPLERLKGMRVNEINTLAPEQIAAEMKRALREKRNYFIFRHRLASGETRDVEVHSSPLEMNGNTYLYSIVHDITERRRAEESLRESESRFRALSESAPVVIFRTDPAGHWTYANPRWEQISGYSPEETKADGWVQAVHPDDLRVVSREWAEAIEAGREFSLDYRLLTPAGQVVWVQSHAAPMRRARGPIVGYVGTLQDITERKRSESEIRRLNESLERRVAERTAELARANEELQQEIVERENSEEARQRLLMQEQHRAEQLRGLAETSLDLNSAHSVEETLQVITERARTLIGAHLAVTSLTFGHDWAQSINSISLSEKYAAWQDYAAQPEGTGIYSLLARTNRPVRLTEAQLKAHPDWKGFGRHGGDHPSLRGWLAAPLIARDGRNLGLIQLSDRYEGEFTAEDEAILAQLAQVAAVAIENVRLLGELRASVRAREQLLSVASHDLKNPLGAMKGFAQLLQRRIARGQMPEPAQLSDSLTKIISSANRMERMIADLLDFARLQAGQPIVLQRHHVDLVALTRRKVTEYVQSGRGTLHEVVLDSKVQELPGDWDEVRLEQVVDNLLSNAMKYSPDGSRVLVTVDQAEDERGRWALLTVRDQGIGIPSADLPYIFDWYHRASNVADSTVGTGIGLASARHIVEQHGGSIWVASREGEGSTFTMRLPLES